MSPLPFIVLLATSPWSPAEWRINLNIGREQGTYMPEDWGASGARLSFPVSILVNSERNELIDDYLGDAKPFGLDVLEDPVFVGANGEQTVPIDDTGSWKISMARSGKLGDSNKVRFFLDVSKGIDDIVAQRNDVSLRGKERLYFVANCWRDSGELEEGLRRFRLVEARLEAAQANIDSQLSHESGDRRLDGTNPLETAMATIDMSKLVLERDEALNRLRNAEEQLPHGKLSTAGDWPGSTDKLVIGTGKIAVKRKKGLWSEEFYIIGSWTATPIENEDFEYYEEDEEAQQNPLD